MTMTLPSSKILTRDATAERVSQLRRRGGRLCYTSGVFDILHPGHVEYLAEARSRADMLAVGVNSDRSVRTNKGEARPVHHELDRAKVVAGLASVDVVFVFDELTNERNIEILRPEVYVKGGDYSPETLTSTDTVRAYGGEVVIVPFRSGYSTTASIRRIVATHPPEACFVDGAPYDRRPAVFLDRDGTINEHIDYLHEPERFVMLPGALEGLGRLYATGLRLVVVTNQPGIGTGYFTLDDFFRVNKRLLEAASASGVTFDRIYFCPHSKGDHCRCRKPETGMLERAMRDLNVDLAASYVVGDMTSDVEMGRRAGCRTILVRTGRAGSDGLYDVAPDIVADDLLGAASVIEAETSAALRLAI